MYKLIVRRIAKQTFAALSRGDVEAPLSKFAPDVHFRFAGDNAMGADVHDVEGAREWFARTFGMFDDIRFHPHTVVVDGWPWNTAVASHFSITARRRDGQPYENQGMQLLRLRWGRVVEDFIFEDTQHIAATLDELAEQGVQDAAKRPIGRAEGSSAPRAVNG